MKHVLVVMMLACTLANAQSTHNAGAAGGQFLKIGVGARAMGMGGAYGSAGGDVTSLAWNPAGIGLIGALQVSAQHTVWVADINHNFIGVVLPLTDHVNIGLHTVYLTSGEIEITTIDEPEGTGRFYDAADIAVGLTSSVRLTEQLTFAATVKYIEERLADVKSNTVALDAGAWYDTGLRSLHLGFTVSHLGFESGFAGRSLEVRYEPPNQAQPPVRSELQTLDNALPYTFRASGSFDVFTMFDEPMEDHGLVAALDFIQHSDVPERLAIGAEYTWQNTFSIRSGYLFNADELGWSGGAGVRVETGDVFFNVDYAASSLGRFGFGHRIGVSIASR